MAKIDLSKIEGYAEMTVEEKLAVLESFEFDEPKTDTSEIERLKVALSKSNSEAAEYKKALRSKQTDEEAKAAKEAEERQALERELDTLRKEKAVAGHKASYLALGYDEDTAQANAEALVTGNYSTIFANEKEFIELQRKAAVSGALSQQPGLSSGEPLNGKDKEAAEEATLRKNFGLPPM
nr:MAG TPA: hypothetical protein [Caudoviricetes sp.]